MKHIYRWVHPQAGSYISALCFWCCGTYRFIYWCKDFYQPHVNYYHNTYHLWLSACFVKTPLSIVWSEGMLELCNCVYYRYIIELFLFCPAFFLKIKYVLVIASYSTWSGLNIINPPFAHELFFRTTCLVFPYIPHPHGWVVSSITDSDFKLLGQMTALLCSFPVHLVCLSPPSFSLSFSLSIPSLSLSHPTPSHHPPLL